ncbi:hypothetical protein EWM64_g8019, partial [Hericium alpestre]
LLGTAGKVASGWGGWGGGAKAPAAAPSAAGGWGSPAKTAGWGSTGSSATKGATGWGSQSKAPAVAGGWGSAGTAAGWGSTGGAEENKDADSWNLLDKSEANENNSAEPNKGWGSGGWGGGSGAGSDQNKSSGDLLELDTVQTNHAEAAPVITEAVAEAPPTDVTPADGDAAPEASAEGEAGAAEVATTGEDANGKTKEHLKLDTATGASAGPTTGTGASQLPSAVDTPAEEDAGGGDDDAKEEEKEESKDNKQGVKGKKGKAKKGKGKK